jgi:hypothetical protein
MDRAIPRESTASVNIRRRQFTRDVAFAFDRLVNAMTPTYQKSA